MNTLESLIPLLSGPTASLVVKATILVLVAWIVSLGLHRSTAAARHLVWLGALVGLLALPALSRMPSVRVSILPSAPVAPSAPVPTTVSAVVALPGDVPPATPVVANADEPAIDPGAMPIAAGVVSSGGAPSAFHVGTFILDVWLAVVAALLVWLGYGAVSVHRILRESHGLTSADWQTALSEAADRLAVPSVPRLVASDRVEMAFACDILHPTIVLPSSARTWSEDCRRAVLLHELAHVRRRDLMGHAVGRLACAVYWFHPLAWVAARRLRAESERACDDLVLSAGAVASDYAQHLLDLVMSVRAGAAPALALPMARKKEFEGRLVAILDPDQPRSAPGRARSVALAGVVALMVIAVGAIAPVRRTTPAFVRAAAPAAARTDADVANTLPHTSVVADSQPRSPVQRDSIPPIRQLGVRLAAFDDSLGSVSGIRQLGDGRVFINDTAKRQLLLVDAKLTHPIVVAADTTGANNVHSGPPMTTIVYGAHTGIVAYRADTTLLIDPVARSMSVIDARGAIVRSGAPPGDAFTLTLPIGHAAVDATGRMVYRGVETFCPPIPGIPCTYILGRHAPEGVEPSAAIHDSVPVVRRDVATGVLDTIGFLAVPYLGAATSPTQRPDGSFAATQTVPDLLEPADDWAVVADGSVALVRGQDYHIDWVNVDGSRSSTPPIAHDWRRLSASDKAVILDSAKRFIDSVMQATAARRKRSDSTNAAAGRPAFPIATTTYEWPEVSDLPDYRPAIAQSQGGIVRADADNNLWIRQGGSNNYLPGSGPLVYDIVNRQGRLVDRVELPRSTSIAGFGPGIVYLTSRASWGTTIAAYRIH